MAHGYLRDWDEGWGRSGERERSDRDWRDRHRDRSGDWDERGRSAFMLGKDRGREDWERAPRNFRSHQDDHYLSWRYGQIAALDGDYEDYCREREQQFHRDFDEWRTRRAGNPQPLRTGMTQSGISHDPSGEYQLTTESMVGRAEPDPTSEATLGTNSSEGPAPTRGRAKTDV